MTIDIIVENKIARTNGTPVIVCGNSDYIINFTFDGEWDGITRKTARFVNYTDNGRRKNFVDVAFTGDAVKMPVMSNITEVYIGVYADDIRTTTPARVECKKSILCGTGETEDIFIASADLWELYEVIPQLDVNIAKNRSVSASSVFDPFGIGQNAAKNAVDGDNGTRWTANNTDTNPWLRVYLGGNKNIYKVCINWFNMPQKYRLETSVNGSAWTTVCEGTGNDPSDGEHITEDAFAVNNAKYLRVFVETKLTDYISINELSVYGYEKAD